MGMDAGITIVFLDKYGKKIYREYIDCYKGNAAGDTFSIAHGADKVKVYYSTEYDRYSDSDMSDSENESYTELDFKRLFTICKSEIDNKDAQKSAQFRHAVCESNDWRTLLSAEADRLRNGSIAEKELSQRIDKFDDYICDYYEDPSPKPFQGFIGFLQFLMWELKEDYDNDNDFDYKPLCKILMDTFEDARHMEERMNTPTAKKIKNDM